MIPVVFAAFFAIGFCGAANYITGKDGIYSICDASISRQLDELAGRMDAYSEKIALEDLAGTFSSTGKYAFIIKEGVIIAHYDPSKVGMDISSSAWAKSLIASGKSKWVELDGQRWYGGSRASNNSTLCALIPESELSDLNSLARNAIVFSSLAIAAVAVVAWIALGRILTRPLKALNRDMKRIASGDVDVEVSLSSSDELGELSESALKMSRTIKLFIEDMRRLAYEVNVLGNIDAQIDESRHEGALKAAAEAINEAVTQYKEDVLLFLRCLDDVGGGNLDFDLPALPGKKKVMNDSFRVLCQRIKSIISDISSLAVSASSGRLSGRLEAQDYSGEWFRLCAELNMLLDRVIDPIHEANEVMRKISRGILSASMTGAYAGEYLELKDSINLTASIVSDCIEEISLVLSQMAENKLDGEIASDFAGDFQTIKIAVNSILRTFNTFLEEISQNSLKIDENAGAILQSSGSLAVTASEQSFLLKNLEDLSGAMNSKTEANAADAREAELLAARTSDDAANGNKAMDKMIEAMENIKESSHNISKIIKTIEDIAFQTDLLALNAAVESARAGEHGKGFAVVAGEVRNLAARSSAAAKETTALIEDSLRKVDEGARIAGCTSDSFKKIAESILNVSSTISKIAENSNEQAADIQTINGDVEKISQGVQGITDISEETAAVAQQLSEYSQSMKKMLALFTLKQKGHGKRVAS
ncbi:MAG: methyl-accepting chemotaxis protein [Clostridiales bacterium]|jgi:methyl-accepting chemotaxis protein|nr:methyl-accepting chemotaxis protein [Clostridiales bacterium]